MPIKLKRAYEVPTASDGARVLVDRLWPRGISKADAKLTAWLRDIAPSNELRLWYHSNFDQWDIFQTRYLKELGSPEAEGGLAELRKLVAEHSSVTLVFASRNLERNNALVLKQLLEGANNSATGSEPHGTASARGRVRATKR
jgi:uncharacterized protein YeaO (DUF488 family)